LTFPLGFHSITKYSAPTADRKATPGMVTKHNKNCTPRNQGKTVSYVQNLQFQGNLSRLEVTGGLRTLRGSKSLDSPGDLVGISPIVTTTDVYTVNSIQGSIDTTPTTSLNGDSTCGKCTVVAESVQLIYWPESTSTATNNSIITPIPTNSITDATTTPTPTDIVTTVINGTTFTSPSIYLSYLKVSTTRESCNNTGKSYSGALLTLNPSALSSLEDQGLIGDFILGSSVLLRSMYTPRSFNYANLNKPAPYSVFMAQPENAWRCLPWNPCVCDLNQYNPILSVPKEIAQLDPAWKYCDIYLFGSYDPPRALAPASALTPETSTMDPTVPSFTAEPTSSFNSRTVMRTTTQSTQTSGASNPYTSAAPAAIESSSTVTSRTWSSLASAPKPKQSYLFNPHSTASPAKDGSDGVTPEPVTFHSPTPLEWLPKAFRPDAHHQNPEDSLRVSLINSSSGEPVASVPAQDAAPKTTHATGKPLLLVPTATGLNEMPGAIPLDRATTPTLLTSTTLAVMHYGSINAGGTKKCHELSIWLVLVAHLCSFYGGWLVGAVG